MIDWINIVTGEVYEDSYCDTLKYLLDESTSYDKFNECILKSGKKTENIIKHKCKWCFRLIRETLDPINEQINELLHSLN